MRSTIIGLAIFSAIIFQLVGNVEVFAVGETWQVVETKPGTTTAGACPTYTVTTVVEGFSSLQQVCIFRGEKMEMGTFYADGGSPALAVKYPLDTKFYKVENVCSGLGGCVYSSSGDILITRSVGWNNTPHAFIFRHASERIQRVFDTVTGKTTFVFDISSPDFLPSTAYETPLSIGTVALSENGKWAVMEEKNVGILLINLENFVMRRILRPGPTYGHGMDPREELAISNNGETVAMMGDNTGFIMIEVTTECGAPSDYELPIVEPCPWVMPDLLTIFPSFRLAVHPVFDKRGGLLNFYVSASGQSPTRVVVQKPGYSPERIKYIALGDSFSSGEGEENDLFYKQGTNDGSDHCHVSARSYAYKVGLWSNPQNIACAGAKTSDVVSEDRTYQGQGKRLIHDALRSMKQNTALDTFMPGWVPQVAFVERYKPEVISIGIGGNDAGFMTKLKTCAMPGTCAWVDSAEGKQKTGEEIQRLYYLLGATYRTLKNESPQSMIYAVGYPQILGEDICDPITGFLLNHEEREFMRQGISYINVIIKAAAESSGVFYMDTEDSFRGYQLCGGMVSGLAVNGLRPGDDISLTESLPMLKIIGSETFHPTPFGHTLLAETFSRNYSQAATSPTCSECMPPPLSDYWSDESSGVGHPDQFATDLTSEVWINPSDPVVKVDVPVGTLDPGSAFEIEIHSEAIFVGKGEVGSNGGFSQTFKLERALAEGFHTIHVYGTSYSHDSVDLYQLISYGNKQEEKQKRFSGFASFHATDNSPNGDVLGVTSKSPLERNSDKKHTTHPFVIVGLVLIVGGCFVLVGCTIFLKIKKHRYQNSTQDHGG